MEKYTSFEALLSARKNSTLPALMWARDQKRSQMTYAKLYSCVMSEAKALRGERYSSELIVCDHEPRTVTHLLASVIAGKTVALGDVSLSEEALGQMVAVTGAEKVYSSEEALGKKLSAQCAPSKASDCKGEGRLIFFTSGTSARSKAAILTSEAFAVCAWNGQMMLPCGEGDVILSLLPLAHVFGFVCSLLWGLAYGSSVALGRGIRYYLQDCKFFKPTILPSVPSMLGVLCQADALNTELRTVLIGAAPCSQKLIDLLHAKGVSVRFGYGLTETASGVAISMNDENPFAMQPCPDADIRIEPDGEVSIKTSSLMLGYLGGGGLTEDGRFMTGDLGALDENGALRITGRKKDILVLSDGTKIFCAEYEQELAALIGTEELAVILRRGRPVLIIGPQADLEKAEKAVNEYNKSLPRSQQLCGAYKNDAPLPRTATGKLCRWAIK